MLGKLLSKIFKSSDDTLDNKQQMPQAENKSTNVEENQNRSISSEEQTNQNDSSTNFDNINIIESIPEKNTTADFCSDEKDTINYNIVDTNEVGFEKKFDELYPKTSFISFQENNIFKLTSREMDFIVLFTNGINRKNIANYYGLDYSTVKKSIQLIRKKMNCSDDDKISYKFRENYKYTDMYNYIIYRYAFSYSIKLKEVSNDSYKTLSFKNMDFNYSNSSNYDSNISFYLYDSHNSNSYMGKVQYVGNGTEKDTRVKILKDSYMNKLIIADKHWLDYPWLDEKRKKLIDSKIVIEDRNIYKFNQDYIFDSPNECVNIVLGYIVDDGWAILKNDKGYTMKEVIHLFPEDPISNNDAEKYIIKEYEKQNNDYNAISVRLLFEDVLGYPLISKITNDNVDQMRNDFDTIISCLNFKEKRMLILKYGLLSGEKMTYREVVPFVNITAQGIRASIVRIIEKIKETTTDKFIEEYFAFSNSTTNNGDKLKEDMDFIMSLMK